MTMRERSRRSFFALGADGATAPETLRHKDRDVRTIWRETPPALVSTEGDIRFAQRLGRIKLSGTVTEGAPTPV